MIKKSYHPKAFLINKKNVNPGLSSRSKIAFFLENKLSSTKLISQNIKMKYSTTLYHLHLMEESKITERFGEKSYLWKLTGSGQTRLTRKLDNDKNISQ